jgi:lipopolysaccharide/colanic/teichoic acid biosynthesis glycosyltransferase
MQEITSHPTKRLFDIIFSSLGILILFFPFLLLAFAVKFSTPGPFFFRQQRIGRHGKPFRIIKLRTMYIGSNDKGTITSADDKRITPIGHFLRNYKLDEFPQLWNVLIGKMSFVGPRPDV